MQILFAFFIFEKNIPNRNAKNNKEKTSNVIKPNI